MYCTIPYQENEAEFCYSLGDSTGIERRGALWNSLGTVGNNSGTQSMWSIRKGD